VLTIAVLVFGAGAIATIATDQTIWVILATVITVTVAFIPSDTSEKTPPSDSYKNGW
jgi:hypothetical protein